MKSKRNEKKDISRKKQNKNKFSVKIFILFILFEIIFTGLTAPLIVFYGPFENVKRLVVGTSISSFRAQFIAKTFLSQSDINKILGIDSAQASSDSQIQDMDEINLNNKGDKNIERYDIIGSKYKGYLLVVHDPTRVKVGMTKYLGKQGQRTSEIAEENDAVAAINGGGFTDKSSDGTLWAGTGGLPLGLVMSDGDILYNDIDKGVRTDMAAITKEGYLLVGNYNADELKDMEVSEAISFGPTLVMNGQGKITGDGGQGITARTAIGQRKDGAMLLLVLDGRHVTVPGATLKDLERVMLDNGAYNAINLDGGSSATMYYNDEVINNPCNPFGERTVATAIYVEP